MSDGEDDLGRPVTEEDEAREARRVADMTDVATTAQRKAEEDAHELSFEQQVAAVERVVTRQPLNREIAYAILRYCLERRVQPDVEAYVEGLPEYQFATLDPYHQIDRLVVCGGLERFDLDADGEIVTAAQLEGLSEDEADDLVQGYAYQTTDAGEQAVNEGTPQARMEGLFQAEPERRDTYVELLSFFDEEPRSYQDVCELLDGRDVMFHMLEDGSEERIQPSVFVDRLERAGMIVWNDGWALTDEGRQCVEELA